MSLTDLKRRENMHHFPFRNKREAASDFHYVWARLFWSIRQGEPWADLIIWEVGETVNVRPACSVMDESNKKFKKPAPIYSVVYGYKEELKKIRKQKDASSKTIKSETEALHQELVGGTIEAILAGKDYANAKKRYKKFNPEDRPLTVLVTEKDNGLHASDFKVIWKNDAGLTLRQIKTKVKATKGKPLPQGERELSGRQQHLQNLKNRREKEAVVAKKYWANEKKKAEARKPGIRKKLITQLEKSAAKTGRATTKKSVKTATQKSFLLSLDDGNQHDLLIAPSVNIDKLVDTLAAYKWTNFDVYDNRVFEYMYALLDPAIQKAKTRTVKTLWKKLNRAQKVFYTFLQFTGEIDNGGVWQFLFNSPDLSLAALEMLQEIGATKLAKDYQKTLEEVVGKGPTLSALRKKFDDQKLTTKKRWDSFAQGYEELTTTNNIEKYIYTQKFKKTLYKQMGDYVEASFEKFAAIKLD